MADASLLISVAASMGEELTVWAEGGGARAVACALPFHDTVIKATLEAAALELADDEAYARAFFLPGVCALGGLNACIELADCAVDMI